MNFTLFYHVLRAILGLIMVLFLPGYLISNLIIREIDRWERIALSIGLSIAATVAASFLLSAFHALSGLKAYTPIGMSSLLSLSCIILSFFQRGPYYEAGVYHT